MMKICYLFFTLFAFLVNAQDSIVISGEFLHNRQYSKLIVNKFNVGSFPVGAASIKDGKFSINVPQDIEPGVYRLHYSQIDANSFIDVIINGKEFKIHFEWDVDDVKGIPHFIHSQENKLWYSYKKQSYQFLRKLQLLEQLISNYPEEKDDIYTKNTAFFTNLQEEYKKFKAQFVNQNSDSYAALLTKNQPFWLVNPSDDLRLKNFYRKEHFWDEIDTADPRLINTPLYSELILEYLQYYMNPEANFSDEEKTEGLKNSVDVIMTHFSKNTETRNFAYRYLNLGFKEIGQEKITQYIDEKYKNIAEQCLAEDEKKAFNNRLKGYETIKIGKKAPNVFYLDSSGNKQELYQIKAEQILVVFWASWCGHCTEEMPKVNQWAKAHPQTKVLAISLDEDKKEYDKTIALYPNLIHTTDLKKWDGKAVNDYFIYATPTFIVLDKDKKITGKYTGIKELGN